MCFMLFHEVTGDKQAGLTQHKVLNRCGELLVASSSICSFNLLWLIKFFASGNNPKTHTRKTRTHNNLLWSITTTLKLWGWDHFPPHFTVQYIPRALNSINRIAGSENRGQAFLRFSFLAFYFVVLFQRAVRSVKGRAFCWMINWWMQKQRCI